MSTRTTAKAWDVPDLKPLDRFVLLALCEYASDNRIVAEGRVSLAAFSERFSISQIALFRSLILLQKRELITVLTPIHPKDPFCTITIEI